MRNSLDKNHYEGEVRLWKNARKDGTVAVIVEGKSDELFYQKFFDEHTTFFSVDGFKNVIDVVKSIENDINEAIGIIDADFRHCTKEEFHYENIFLTDYHDIEMMMISTNAWNEVVNFHSSKTKLKAFQAKHSKLLRDFIIEMAKPLAALRYLNNLKNIGLIFKTYSKSKFDYIDYSKFIDQNDFVINIEHMIGTVENKSQKQNYFKNNPQLIAEFNTILNSNFNLLDFCNGHDILNILSLALKKAIGKKNISGDELEEFFIVAYQYDDFIKTVLYSNLKNWELNKTGLILLKS